MGAKGKHALMEKNEIMWATQNLKHKCKLFPTKNVINLILCIVIYWKRLCMEMEQKLYQIKANGWFFWRDIVTGKLSSVFFCHGTWFYKPTLPQYLPSQLRNYNSHKRSQVKAFKSVCPCFDPNECWMKNGVLNGDSNP